MLNSNVKRVAVYVRVSSEMQLDNYSLDAQENACQSFADLRGWQVVSTFREEGASAKSTDRPIFQQMIRQAEMGQFDVILVHKLDRFSRKLKDMIGIIDYFDEIGVSLVSATEQFDLSTPQGKMMVNVMSSVNQWYLDNLAQEISKGKRQRAKSGDWNGTLSYGYTTPSRLGDMLSELNSQLRKDKISKDDFRAKIEQIEDTLDAYPDAHDTAALPCPFNSSAVVMAFEAYATGQHSFREIADLLNEAGYQCESRDGTGLFSHTMISELLRNRFYIGETSYGAKVKGKRRQWIAGNHDAIISNELFQKVASIRSKSASRYNQNSRNRKRPYPLSPMLVCMDQGIRWRGQVQRGIRRYIRRRNNDIPGTYVKADELENEIIEHLSSISFPADWKQKIVSHLYSDKKPKSNVKQLKQKLERLKKLFVLGHITEEVTMPRFHRQ